MSVKRLRLAHNIAAIATELENVETSIVSVSACINAASTPYTYTKKSLIDKLDTLISQRTSLIDDLNETLSSYNEHVKSLKS